MLLAIDIGNTNIVVGIIKDDDIIYEARIATDRIKTSDQYGVDIKNVLSLFDIKPEEIEDCIISSVVPPVFNSVRTGVMKVIRKEPLVVGADMETGLKINTDIPGQVGSDRIVVAVAAMAAFRDAPQKTLRVATKFANIARQHYLSKGRDIDIIHLNGSIEIAPILGLSDVIVDIVETGTTLKENNLNVIDTVVPISARLIANKASYKFKSGQIDPLVRSIARQTEA